MTQKTKRYLIGTLCTLAAMFLWIFVAVALTGGREVEDFTDKDRIIMTVFIVVEILTVIAAFSFAVLLGNEYGKQIRQTMQTPQTNVNKQTQQHGTTLQILAFLLAFGTMIGGILLRGKLFVNLQDVCGWVLGISLFAAVVMLLLNVALRAFYSKRLEKQQIDKVQLFIYSHRQKAEQTAAKKLSWLRKWRYLTAIYAGVLGLLGLCVALCTGVLLEPGSGVGICFIAVLLIMCAFSRIRPPQSPDVFDESKAYVPETQYTHLYRLAEKAAKEIGCSGKIRIALLPNCNAGIAKVGQSYSVQLGVILLCVLSEEELYCVLLHEFAHMAGHNNQAMKERLYNAWLGEGRIPHFYSGITNQFFAFFDFVYTLQFALYDYAASIQTEATADQAMLLCGDPAVAASSLIKLKYYELFSWEKGTQDEDCAYEPEAPDGKLLTKELQRFLTAMEERYENWDKLIDVEIQSRAASHPTLKLRLEALGIRTPKCIPATASPEYTQECQQALAYVEGLVREDLEEGYKERRKAFYLEPKAQVEAWGKAGKPLKAEEYGDIIWALRQLGRNTEAVEVCQRAIDALPPAASSNAYFIRGCYRLHSYDSDGIADIYTAVENNSNYLEEGIDALGTYCCLTGNQAELDIYRKKAVVLAQKYKDTYSQANVLNKKDKLATEKLPGGMLDEILGYIRSVDDGQIEKIYLVRKPITADFFTSVFVISFDLDTEDDARNEIMHKIFQYLDTCSDWQFSLFDFRDVCNVPFYTIKDSCVYSKKIEENKES